MYDLCTNYATFLKINRPFHSCKFSNYSLSHNYAIGKHLLDNQLRVPFITITIDSLCFLLVGVFFISLLYELLPLELFNLLSVDKKNSFIALKSFISTFNFDWLFSHPIKVRIFDYESFHYNSTNFKNNENPHLSNLFYFWIF